MRNKAVLRLNLSMKALLTAAGAIAVAAPLLVGMMIASPAMAQMSQTLDVWGPFKFGMTVEQARGLSPPGKPWKYYAPPSPATNCVRAFMEFPACFLVR